AEGAGRPRRRLCRARWGRALFASLLHGAGTDRSGNRNTEGDAMKLLPLLLALVFEPSKVDPEVRIFEPDPARQVDAAAMDAVDAERLAATLLDLLALPSKSCQEGPVAKGAERLL